MEHIQKIDLQVPIVAIDLSQQVSHQETPKMLLNISDDLSIQRLKVTGHVCWKKKSLLRFGAIACLQGAQDNCN